jgi:hypothetical protein
VTYWTLRTVQHSFCSCSCWLCLTRLARYLSVNRAFQRLQIGSTSSRLDFSDTSSSENDLSRVATLAKIARVARRRTYVALAVGHLSSCNCYFRTLFSGSDKPSASDEGPPPSVAHSSDAEPSTLSPFDATATRRPPAAPAKSVSAQQLWSSQRVLPNPWTDACS